MASKKRKDAPDAEGLFCAAELHEEQGKLEEAFDCLRIAAQLGHIGAQVNLGNFYAAGQGVRKNPKQAARWYKEAYKNGERTGAHNLAIDLRNQGKIRSAETWFKKAIAMKEGDAYLALAKMRMARRGGQKGAASLLREGLLLSPRDMSDDGKEEAESLLTKLSTM
jgi:TPR repeat protein